MGYESEDEMDEMKPVLAATPGADVHAETGLMSTLSADVVKVLQRSERSENMVSAMVGVVGAAVISLSLTLLSARGVSAAGLFDLRSATGSVPMIILAMAIWSVTWCIMRATRVRALSTAASMSLVEDAVRFLYAHKDKPASALLQGLPMHHEVSPILARVESLLSQWSLEAGVGTCKSCARSPGVPR